MLPARKSRTIHIRDLPLGGSAPIAVQSMAATRTRDLPATLRQLPVRTAGQVSVPAGCSLEEVERLAILQTLELTDWNKRQAAKLLGIHRPTLYNKLRKYRLWRSEDRFRRDPLETVG